MSRLRTSTPLLATPAALPLLTATPAAARTAKNGDLTPLFWRATAWLAGLLTALALLPAAHASGSAPQRSAAAGQAVALSARAPVVPVVIDLGPWQEGGRAAQIEAGKEGEPLVIGRARVSARTATEAGVSAVLQWHTSASGSRIAAMSFRSPGAHALRLGVLVDSLPASAQLRTYVQGQRASGVETSGGQVLQLLQRNRDAGDHSDAGRIWWTPDTEGDEQTLEIELPAGIPTDGVRIALPRVMHAFVEPGRLFREGRKAIGDSGRCNIDATCRDELPTQRDAVAAYAFVDRDGWDWATCTGTLVNDKANSRIPYFLSAGHCVYDQTRASSITFYWFFRSPRCNAGERSPASVKQFGGATMLATSQVDMTLLELNEDPPANAVFAGWDATTQAVGTPVIGLSHPSGDLLKMSLGSIRSHTSYNRPEWLVYGVTWTEGTTEGGSSGSALFVNGFVTGVLWAGSASCRSLGGEDVYTRLDLAYPDFKQWLNPDDDVDLTMGASVLAVTTRFDATQGSLSCPSTVANGRTAHCTATPEPGFVTQSISGCFGSATGAGVNDYTTGAVTRDCEVTAVFLREQTLTFPPQNPASHTFVGGGTFAINPVATSSHPDAARPISYSSLSNWVCTVSGTTVTMLAPGACTIAADQAGDDNHAAATQVTRPVALDAQTRFDGTTVPADPADADTATASFTGGGNTCRFDTANTAFIAAPAALPAGKTLPQGMFQFKLIGCDATPVQMSVQWPQAVSGYTKYGKASANATKPTYFEPENLSIDAATRTVSFTVQDGQKGDDDWAVNGEIVDPTGPTAAAIAPPGSVTAVPTLGEWGLMLLGLLAAGLGARRLRRV